MRSYLQEPVAQTLPDAAEVTIDRAHYYRQVLHGYYQFNCVVSKDVTRGAKFYIPEGSIYNQPTVFIGVPSGQNSWECLVSSGWKALADEYGLYIVLMEPTENGWQNDDADQAYLRELSNDLALRPMFCSFQANFYAVAYGDSADVVAAQCRQAARAYAAAAFIGTAGLSEAEVLRMQETDSRVPGIKLADVQWPVWLTYAAASDDTERQVSYYRHANHSQAAGTTEGSKTVWLPEEGGTLDEEWCAKVITDVQDWRSCVNRAYSEAILTELFDGVYRYPGNNNGALRKVGNIYDRGFKKYSAEIWGGYYYDKRDVYHREWYVYQPASAPEGPLPLLFVYHGAGGSGDEIADRIGWSYIADKYGFLIVMPTASEPNEVREISDMRTNNIFRAMWNAGDPQPERPDDFRFIDYLYNWMVENYPVDRSRVYASGQSSGGMMSWSSAAYRPDRFAAVAPFSARDIDLEAIWRGEEARPLVTTSRVGIIANLGCADGAFKGGFAVAEDFVNMWCEREGAVKRWADYTYMDGGQHCSYKKGLRTHYVFENAEGVPVLHLSETDTKAHATWPTECEEAWVEFLSKYTKDPETATLYYEGKEVH